MVAARATECDQWRAGPTVARVTNARGLEEAGLLLRPAVDGDVERWWQLLRDPEQQRYGAPAFVTLPTGPEGLAERVERSAAAWADGSPATLVVADAHARYKSNADGQNSQV